MKEKLYPESGVELSPFISRNYDRIMAVGSFGHYHRSIRKAIRAMHIQPEDQILDLGCGTGSNAALMLEYLNTGGGILGMDISEEMRLQFETRFQHDDRVSFLEKRIDQSFDLQRTFDKIFIGFVIHGFPHEIRQVIIGNAIKHLKAGGTFFILDFSEFDMAAMPSLHRFVFKTIECKYAFDYIERDWKNILTEQGFGDFSEQFYLKNYMRLLGGVLK